MDNKIKVFLIVLAVTIVGVLALGFLGKGSTQRSTKYDAFAQCLSDKGAIFYGTFWCPYCKNQKKMFENSAKIPYVECSTPDANAQVQICIDKGVKSYPTWDFADGSRLTGAVPLATLAEKTACELPADAETAPASATTGESSSATPAQ